MGYDREQVALLVRGKAAEVLGVGVEEVGESTDLSADFGVDSLELLEIAARVEKTLNVRIGVENIASAGTVGQAIQLLAEQLPSGSADHDAAPEEAAE